MGEGLVGPPIVVGLGLRFAWFGFLGSLWMPWLRKTEINTFVSAFGHLVGPHAHPGLTVVGQSGAALVAGGLAVPTVPEDVALLLVGKDAVEAGTVRRGDGRFELRALAAVHVVQVIAVLGEELAVTGVKCQTVAARLQFRHVVVAFPILVARYVMRIEPEIVRAFEGLLSNNYDFAASTNERENKSKMHNIFFLKYIKDTQERNEKEGQDLGQDQGRFRTKVDTHANAGHFQRRRRRQRNFLAPFNPVSRIKSHRHCRLPERRGWDDRGSFAATSRFYLPACGICRTAYLSRARGSESEVLLAFDGSSAASASVPARTVSARSHDSRTMTRDTSKSSSSLNRGAEESSARRRGGVGGEKKRRWRRVPQEAKRLLTPSSRIDIFLRAFCSSTSRYVRDAPRMSISRLAGCSFLHARDLHSLFRISFASDTEEIGPGDCPQMKFQ
ncbi:hypothetical protein DBV15_09868 [Temnothorax longispinosus]|uniref:Uncharacterized protein n=1 Tax=Temnothorax longispinosus TaxID=300112 RepID=A0A4S2L9V7_9HYME|nr:hypothetical protein DBV15_09868 [Temnothorax longispinosus]